MLYRLELGKPAHSKNRLELPWVAPKSGKVIREVRSSTGGITWFFHVSVSEQRDLLG